MDMFLSVLSVYVLVVSRPSKSFSLSYTIVNFLIASLKLHTNLKMLTEEVLLIIPFTVIGPMFSSADPSLLPGKCRRINLAQAVFSMIFTESQAASSINFLCQNRRSRVFDEGY